MVIEQTTGRIGQSVVRLEDRALLTGTGRFADDIAFAHQLYMRVVRSPVAHGVLSGIDVEAALQVAGVVAVWTREDTADIPPIDFRDQAAEALLHYRQPVLARDKVRYVGEPIAVVFAEDPYAAEDAANLVVPDIEPLAPVLSAVQEPGRFEGERSTEAMQLAYSFGEADTSFQGAHRIVEAELAIGRHSGVPLETRGAIGVYDAGRDLLELYGAAKVPHRNRDSLARMLGRRPGGLHLHEGHTGGGFGVRGELYPEDILVLVAAMRLRRPVKWIEDRRENLVACNHSRQQTHKVRIALDADGGIRGLENTFMHDQGGYIRTHGARVPDFTLRNLPGPYRMEAYRALGCFRLTNKTPAATYRAPGAVRDDIRAGGAAGQGGATVGYRSPRAEAPQLHRVRPDAVSPAVQGGGSGGLVARFRRLQRSSGQGSGAAGVGAAGAGPCCATGERRACRRRFQRVLR